MIGTAERQRRRRGIWLAIAQNAISQVHADANLDHPALAHKLRWGFRQYDILGPGRLCFSHRATNVSLWQLGIVGLLAIATIAWLLARAGV